MTNKAIVVLSIVICAVSFAFGRWSAPEKVRIEKETSQVDTKTKNQDNKSTVDTNKSKKTKTVITETTSPDGTKTKKTEISEDDTVSRQKKSDSSSNEQDTSVSTSKESKVVENKKSSLSLSALGGFDIRHPSSISTPIYGGAVTKNIFGPLGAGVWGLSNGTCGVSIGITF